MSLKSRKPEASSGDSTEQPVEQKAPASSPSPSVESVLGDIVLRNLVISKPGEEPVFCFVCQDVPLNPHQTSCCGHSLCSNHSDDVDGGRCAICNHQEVKSVVDPRTKRSLSGLRVKCPNATARCPWVNNLGLGGRNLATHIVECQYVQVECSREGCSRMLLQKDAPAHEEKCEFPMRACVNAANGCELRVSRAGAAQHETWCEYQLVICPEKECMKPILICSIEEHKRSCSGVVLKKALTRARSSSSDRLARIVVDDPVVLRCNGNSPVHASLRMLRTLRGTLFADLYAYAEEKKTGEIVLQYPAACVQFALNWCLSGNNAVSNLSLSQTLRTALDFRIPSLFADSTSRTSRDQCVSFERFNGLRFEGRSCNFPDTTFRGCVFDESTFVSVDLQRTRFEHCSFRGATFVKCPLGGVTFEKCDFSGTCEALCSFPDSSFRSCDMREFELAGRDLSNCDLTNANMRRMDLTGATLAGATLTGATLSGATLTDATLTGADMRGQDLREFKLAGRDLSNCDLTNANVREMDLAGATLTGATLTGADLRGQNLREFKLAGRNLSNCDLTNANMRRMDLTGATLTSATLTGADLTGATLTGADLTGTILARAKLRGVDLSDVKLADGDLRYCDLTNAKLRRIDLRGANLTGANLTGACLREARIDKVCFGTECRYSDGDEWFWIDWCGFDNNKEYLRCRYWKPVSGTSRGVTSETMRIPLDELSSRLR